MKEYKNTNDEKLSVTANELAKLLNVSEDTAAHLIRRDGEITKDEALLIVKKTGSSIDAVSEFFNMVW